MKVVILAGGLGTRISEQSHLRPKPMIEIGDKPILWHIMKQFTHYGHTEFIICCGYKQHIIKEYFANYYLNNGDVTFDFANNNNMTIHNNISEEWKVTLVDTGLETMTGGRIKRVQKFVGDEPFLMTYGDGVSDIDINKLIVHHNQNKKIATLSAVNVASRFGVLNIDKSTSVIQSFNEKSEDDDEKINGGFMVLEPKIFDYIDSDDTIFEQEPLRKLLELGELCAYNHDGFWQCMDTQREHSKLEEMWLTGNAPWKIW